MKKWLVVLVIVVLAAGGIAYENGWFGGKDKSPAASSAPAVSESQSPDNEPPIETTAAHVAEDDQDDNTAHESASADEQEAVPAWAAGNLPSETVETVGSIAVVTNPASVHVLVNKERNLPSDYVPDDLVVPDVPFSFSGDSPKKQMRKEAAEALEKLVAAARQDDITLKAVSGYRSYNTQKALFDSYAEKDGIEAANRYSAHPGQSEHQTGLTMDISGASVNYALTTELGKTKEGIWLAEHAADYGFIIRYPEGKEHITGYMYEPWHIRYIGVDAAKAVVESGLTLEEYLNSLEVSTS